MPIYTPLDFDGECLYLSPWQHWIIETFFLFLAYVMSKNQVFYFVLICVSLIIWDGMSFHKIFGHLYFFFWVINTWLVPPSNMVLFVRKNRLWVDSYQCWPQSIWLLFFFLFISILLIGKSSVCSVELILLYMLQMFSLSFLYLPVLRY